MVRFGRPDRPVRQRANAEVHRVTRHVNTSESGGVITVTLDRQDKLNAISEEMTADIWAAFEAFRSHDDLRVMVITAVGRYFTAGIDLQSRTGRGGEIDPASFQAGAKYRAHLRNHFRLYEEFESIEKPIVLAAQAHCLGAGVEMALACDFRLAAEGVTFGLPEIRLGVMPASGGVSRLVRLVGPGWARWLAMADRRVDAAAALNMGLIHEVLPVDSFASRVQQFATELTELPQEALGLTKITIDACASADRRTARDIDRIANTTLNFGAEFQARVAAATWQRPAPLDVDRPGE
jgi:enoyl-CoA hydratase/carnithine racemase